MRKLIFAIITVTCFACSSSSRTGTDGGSDTTATNTDQGTGTGNQDNTNFALDTTTLSTGETYFQCPMHPEVVSRTASDCPKCGMALASRTKQ